MINWMYFLSTEGVLCVEIDAQKAIFYFQQKETSETNGLEGIK